MLRVYSNMLVLKDSLDKGYVEIEGDRIVNVVLGQKPQGEFIDMTGKYILPGIINIHSLDYVKETSSKYNRFFSEQKVFYQLEKMYAESGVTTVFHTFTLDIFSEGLELDEVIEKLNYIKNYRSRKFLIDHKVHLKFRLGDLNISKKLKSILASECVDFITCIGYNSSETEEYQKLYFSQYLQNQFEIEEDKAMEIAERMKLLREESALDELSIRLKFAKSKGIPFATSRFELVDKLQKIYKVDIDIIVDPKTDLAIEYIEKNDLNAVVDVECLVANNQCIDFVDQMGADKINILSASKRATDMLEYIFSLEQSIGLPKAVRLVTVNPAMALGMHDKGEIAPGKEADLIAVEMYGDIPINVMTISDGNVIVKYEYNN